MTAILASLSVDAPDKRSSRYFRPYLGRWINDAPPKGLAEKSVASAGGTRAGSDQVRPSPTKKI